MMAQSMLYHVVTRTLGSQNRSTLRIRPSMDDNHDVCECSAWRVIRCRLLTSSQIYYWLQNRSFKMQHADMRKERETIVVGYFSSERIDRAKLT